MRSSSIETQGSSLANGLDRPEFAPLPRWRDGAFIVCLVVGTALCLTWDQAVYDALHAHFNYFTRPVPDNLKLAARVLRSLEDWGENVYISVIAFAVWRLDRTRRSRLLVMVVAVVLVTLTIESTKRITGRQRPDSSQGATIWHGPSQWRGGGNFQSFPSGHTAAGAVFSGWLSACYPPLRPAAVLLAVGCGGSRMWKERHFLSDCFAGGLIGFYVAATLARRRWFQPFMNTFDRWFSTPAPAAESSGRPASLVNESATPDGPAANRTHAA